MGIKNDIFLKIDLAVNSFMPLIQNNFLMLISKIIWGLFDTKSIVIISIILSAYIFVNYSKKEAIFFGLPLLINALFLVIIKNLIGVARPLNSLITEADFSFPSGHTTTAIVFFGLLTYFISTKKKYKTFKSTAILISTFMILLISFTRLYLNAHWLTDILGGFAFGIFILTGSILLKEKLKW